MTFIGKPEKLKIKGIVELFQKVKHTYSCLHWVPIFESHVKEFFKNADIVYLTGIGTSESHARYLEVLMKKHTKFHVKFL